MYARDFALTATPIGMVRLIGTPDAIERVTIEPGSGEDVAGVGALAEAAAQVTAYFARRLTRFDLPLAASPSPRGTVLRDAVVAVPFGETRSYGGLAREVASGARAVGQVCARNPMPIIVPCHRITNADGSLGAYSAGDGPNTKRWLLEFEGGWERLI